MFEYLVTQLAKKNIPLTRQQIIYLRILCGNKIVPSRVLSGASVTNLSKAMSRLQDKINDAGVNCSISATRIAKERDAVYGWSINCEQIP